jgi:hypothetical protein
MSEHYDEFSFYMPNPAFRDMITSAAARRFDNHRLVTYFNSSSMKNTEERDLETLKSGMCMYSCVCTVRLVGDV